jgi:energy-coupling factor transporter ATP-binding protein EcfA2
LKLERGDVYGFIGPNGAGKTTTMRILATLLQPSYGEATESSGVVKITSDLAKPIERKHVLIVEDIVDTGLTMRYLLDNLATRRPSTVKLCTLLHKPSRARTRIPIDYLGFQIEDRFVVGYGLDAAACTATPFIGVLQWLKRRGGRGGVPRFVLWVVIIGSGARLAPLPSERAPVPRTAQASAGDRAGPRLPDRPLRGRHG